MMPGRSVTNQTQTDLLRERLATLLREEPIFDGRTRRLRCGPNASPMATILREISETHLPRTLIFRNDRDENITFAVASGRVLRMSENSSETLMTAITPQAARAAFASAKGQGPAIAQLLAAFTDQSAQFTVETQVLQGATSALDTGVNVDDIRLASATSDQTTTDLIAEMLEACEPFSIAAVLLSADRKILRFGPEAEQALLIDLADSERSQSGAPETIEGPISCVIYAGHPSEGTAILCIARGSQLGLLTFETQVLDQVLDRWQDISTSAYPANTSA